jgi:hypothetical protein
MQDRAALNSSGPRSIRTSPSIIRLRILAAIALVSSSPPFFLFAWTISPKRFENKIEGALNFGCFAAVSIPSTSFVIYSKLLFLDSGEFVDFKKEGKFVSQKSCASMSNREMIPILLGWQHTPFQPAEIVD